MKPTVAILLSDKRSGSTMFENELCKHSSIEHVAYTPHSYAETHYWVMAACLLEMPKELFSGGKRPTGYGSRPEVRRRIIDCIRGNVPDFIIPEEDEALVYEGWEALCSKFAQPVFFEKSPQHAHHQAALDLIMKWANSSSFDVRFIGLIRNPMAVMYSAQELFTTDPEKRQLGWAKCYRNILAFKETIGDELFLMVRYEDLIERPGNSFAEICRFIGVDYDDRMGGKIHNRSLFKWRDDPAFTLCLDESVARLAYDFGYKTEEIYNPPKPGLTPMEKYVRAFKAFLLRSRSRFYNRFVKTFMLSTLRRK